MTETSYEIRWHGRGGQGGRTFLAAELPSQVLNAQLHSQNSFPSELQSSTWTSRCLRRIRTAMEPCRNHHNDRKQLHTLRGT